MLTGLKGTTTKTVRVKGKYVTKSFNVIKLFTLFMDVGNKCLLLACLFSLVQCLWLRPGVNPRMEEHLKGATLQ